MTSLELLIVEAIRAAIHDALGDQTQFAAVIRDAVKEAIDEVFASKKLTLDKL